MGLGNPPAPPIGSYSLLPNMAGNPLAGIIPNRQQTAAYVKDVQNAMGPGLQSLLKQLNIDPNTFNLNIPASQYYNQMQSFDKYIPQSTLQALAPGEHKLSQDLASYGPAMNLAATSYGPGLFVQDLLKALPTAIAYGADPTVIGHITSGIQDILASSMPQPQQLPKYTPPKQTTGPQDQQGQGGPGIWQDLIRGIAGLFAGGQNQGPPQPTTTHPQAVMAGRAGDLGLLPALISQAQQSSPPTGNQVAPGPIGPQSNVQYDPFAAWQNPGVQFPPSRGNY